MGQIQAVLFWMSGVVTQSIPAVLNDILLANGRPQIHLAGLPEFNAAQEQFTLGQMSDLEFCRRLGQLARLEEAPEGLRQRMLSAFAPRPATLELIGTLPAVIERWLIADLPAEWHVALAHRLNLQSCFAPERLILLGQSLLPRLIPDVFYYLSRSVHREGGNCLLVDPLLRRAMEGINCSFPTAHYVNPRLLKQEFYLRGFTGRTTLNHKPDVVL